MFLIYQKETYPSHHCASIVQFSHCTIFIYILSIVCRHYISVYSCSDCSREDVCGVQAAGADNLPKEACGWRYCFFLAVVPHMEFTSTVWLGQVRSGGGRDILCTRLAQSRAS